MKVKEIKSGVQYVKRGPSAEWAVPVTTEYLYEFSKYSRSRFDNKFLHSGRGVVVISAGYGYGAAQRPDVETVIAEAAKITLPETGHIADIVERLKKKGMVLDIWFPREFVGTMEEITKAREEEQKRDKAIKESRMSEFDSITKQYNGMISDLDINPYANISSVRGEVTFSFREFKKLMDRMEAVIQSETLSGGKL